MQYMFCNVTHQIVQTITVLYMAFPSRNIK